MAENLVRLAREPLLELAMRALQACGASVDQANSLARAAVDADAHGHHGQGIDHLDPYCDGLRQGRLDGQAVPVVTLSTPVIIQVDAHQGTAHLAFDRAFEQTVAAAQQFGLAALSCANSFPCGELGYFIRRLLVEGLGGMAGTNAGPALLAASGAKRPVFCTNPLAFGVPAGNRQLLIDQASSATAFTNLRIAARDDGAVIPLGWALDAAGEPTTDPKAAIDGVLLAYGGSRGANMALMVELLAAGLSGANWSLDAPAFHRGNDCPGGGLFIFVFDPTRFGDADASARIGVYLDRLEQDFGVHVPGQQKFAEQARTATAGIAVPQSAVEMLERYAQGL